MRTLRSLLLVVSVVIGLGKADAARAEWREASSAHFVVYGNESESTLRQFALNLERYHATMSLLTGAKQESPSPSNRVTIYAVGGVDQVRKLYGENASRYIGGFYQPRAGGTFAIVPDISGQRVADWDTSLRTVLHEYAHHFLIGQSGFPLPAWANEGAAEFFSSASFEKDGAVNIGRPNPTRLIEANTMTSVPIEQLLGSVTAPVSKASGYTTFYARSWLLYHYLTLGSERRGQIKPYFAALGRGQQPLEAAREAFGALDVLNREIDAYRRKPRFTTLLLKGANLPIGSVAVRLLSRGEAQTMALRIQQHRGVDRTTAPGIAAEMRSFAQQFADDATVQAALAEAEQDAGNHEAAVAAANRALAINPRLVNAHVQKCLALMRIATKSRSDSDINAARAAMALPLAAAPSSPCCAEPVAGRVRAARLRLRRLAA